MDQIRQNRLKNEIFLRIYKKSNVLFRIGFKA